MGLSLLEDMLRFDSVSFVLAEGRDREWCVTRQCIILQGLQTSENDPRTSKADGEVRECSAEARGVSVSHGNGPVSRWPRSCNSYAGLKANQICGQAA